MTINEIAGQLHKMSKGHVFGRRYTKRELESKLRLTMARRNEYTGIITLADGEWLFSLSKFGDKADQFDYYIPDTREQETELMYRSLGLA